MLMRDQNRDINETFMSITGYKIIFGIWRRDNYQKHDDLKHNAYDG